MRINFIINILFLVLSTSLSGQNIASISGNSVSINNGSIEAMISGGRMSNLNIIGGNNLLKNGGYGYFSYVDQSGYYSPTSLSPIVTVNNNDIADIYFEHVSSFIIEMHYVFRKGESGFYTYFVTSDNDEPFRALSELRWAVRVDKNVFDYGWTIEREGPMIHPSDLEAAVDEIQDATYLLNDGSIYTKYDWSVDTALDTLHGLMGNDIGIWNIEASSEYINGGPTMQDLTIHGTTTTPILLSTLQTSHYGNTQVALKDEYLEWNKIYGPAFTYINQGSHDQLIADAQAKTSEKIAEWPYSWLINELYPIERSTFSGSLNMIGKGVVDSAMVVLSKPPASWYPEGTDFQLQPYDYIFWDEADKDGNFKLEKVRPGIYNLYAYTQKGKLIEQLELNNIEVTAGDVNIGEIDWNANDKTHTIFQVGQADHKSSEFGLADLPRLYGRWKDTPDNLDYKIGESNDREHWYYCQRENTTYNINFNINNLDSLFDPILSIGFAGSDADPNLDAILNDQEIGYIKTGSDSGIRRSSLSGGKYSTINFPFDKSILQNGMNTLTLSCYGSPQEYKGIMYDAILLQANIDDPVSTSTQINQQIYSAYGDFKNITVQSNAQSESKVNIYTLATGQLIYSGNILPGSNNIPVGQAGQYVLIIRDANHSYHEKIILF